VLSALDTLLCPGGRLLMKLFMDPTYAAQFSRLRERFVTLKSTRPESTRRGSAEMYVVGEGFRSA